MIDKVLKGFYWVLGLLVLIIIAGGVYAANDYLKDYNFTPRQSFNKLIKLDEFRGIELGSHVADNDNLELLIRTYSEVSENKFNLSVYKKENENLKIGDLNVKEILYSYYKDKLYKIEIKGNLKEKAVDFKEVYTDLYGKLYAFDNDYYIWKNSDTELVLITGYNELSRDNVMQSITYLSTEISEEMDNDLKELEQEKTEQRINNRAKDL